MVFIDCAAPFRTALNLVRGAHGHTPDIRQRLAALSPSTLGDGHCRIEWLTDPGRSRFERYAHEGEDDVPPVFVPLATLNGPALAPTEALPAGVALQNVLIELHDSTVALARFRLSGPGVPQFVASGAYSAASHALALSIARQASGFINELLEILLEQQKALPRQDRMVLAPRDFRVFADIADLADETGAVRWSEPPVLWTNRTVVADSEAALIDIGHGANLKRMPSPIHGHDLRYRFEVGSVFIVADNPSYEGSGYGRVMGWLQVFSALLDILRREFPTAPLDVDRPARGAAFVHRLNAIKRYANTLTETYVDLSLGVQHERRYLLDVIAECFEIDRLIDISRRRVATVIDQVADVRANANARARSLFEKAAFALAALTVVDIVINLLWFTKGDYQPETEWPTWSQAPLELVRGVSSDTVIMATLICILILLALRMGARE